jgi:alkylation response protein AidB-like acyl-CoA dehydrogenase
VETRILGDISLTPHVCTNVAACSVGIAQWHGGYGSIREFPLGRCLRDVWVHQILEGTNELMRVIVSRRMLKAGATEAIR